MNGDSPTVGSLDERLGRPTTPRPRSASDHQLEFRRWLLRCPSCTTAPPVSSEAESSTAWRKSVALSLINVPLDDFVFTSTANGYSGGTTLDDGHIVLGNGTSDGMITGKIKSVDEDGVEFNVAGGNTETFTGYIVRLSTGGGNDLQCHEGRRRDLGLRPGRGWQRSIGQS